MTNKSAGQNSGGKSSKPNPKKASFNTKQSDTVSRSSSNKAGKQRRADNSSLGSEEKSRNEFKKGSLPDNYEIMEMKDDLIGGLNNFYDDDYGEGFSEHFQDHSDFEGDFRASGRKAHRRIEDEDDEYGDNYYRSDHRDKRYRKDPDEDNEKYQDSESTDRSEVNSLSNISPERRRSLRKPGTRGSHSGRHH